MTLDVIKKRDKAFLNAADIVRVLNSDLNCIRFIAQKHTEQLVFPEIVIRCRVHIPKVPFLKFLGVRTDENGVA